MIESLSVQAIIRKTGGSKTTQGVCKLCGRWAELRRSHVLPDMAYADVIDPASHPRTVVVRDVDKGFEWPGWSTFPPTILIHGDADADVPFDLSQLVARAIGMACSHSIRATDREQDWLQHGSLWCLAKSTTLTRICFWGILG